MDVVLGRPTTQTRNIIMGKPSGTPVTDVALGRLSTDMLLPSFVPYWEMKFESLVHTTQTSEFFGDVALYPLPTNGAEVSGPLWAMASWETATWWDYEDYEAGAKKVRAWWYLKTKWQDVTTWTETTLRWPDAYGSTNAPFTSGVFTVTNGHLPAQGGFGEFTVAMYTKAGSIWVQAGGTISGDVPDYVPYCDANYPNWDTGEQVYESRMTPEQEAQGYRFQMHPQNWNNWIEAKWDANLGRPLSHDLPAFEPEGYLPSYLQSTSQTFKVEGVTTSGSASGMGGLADVPFSESVRKLSLTTASIAGPFTNQLVSVWGFYVSGWTEWLYFWHWVDVDEWVKDVDPEPDDDWYDVQALGFPTNAGTRWGWVAGVDEPRRWVEGIDPPKPPE